MTLIETFLDTQKEKKVIIKNTITFLNSLFFNIQSVKVWN